MRGHRPVRKTTNHDLKISWFCLVILRLRVTRSIEVQGLGCEDGGVGVPGKMRLSRKIVTKMAEASNRMPAVEGL